MDAVPVSYRTVLAERMTRLRLQAKATPLEAGIGIGVDANTVEKLEGGHYQFSLERFARLCRLYRAEPADVLRDVARIVLGTDQPPSRFDALLLFCGVTPQEWTSGEVEQGPVPEFDPREVAAVAQLRHHHPRRKACARALRAEYEKGSTIRDLVLACEDEMGEGPSFGRIRSMLLQAGTEMRH